MWLFLMVGMKCFAFAHALLLERGQVGSFPSPSTQLMDTGRRSSKSFELVGAGLCSHNGVGTGSLVMGATAADADTCRNYCAEAEWCQGYHHNGATNCGLYVKVGAEAAAQADVRAGFSYTVAPDGTQDITMVVPVAGWVCYRGVEAQTSTNASAGDGYWYNKTFEKLDNVSAMMDELERTQFHETLAISTLEGDLGSAGIKIGDYEQEAVPFEKSVYVLRHNLSLWRNFSVDAEQEFNTDEAEVVSLENRTKAVMKSPEEMAAARAANEALEEARERLGPDAGPLLSRAQNDSAAFDGFEELALNKTEQAAGAMNVRGAIDRAREAMRVVAAKSYEHGIPMNLRPDRLVAQFE